MGSLYRLADLSWTDVRDRAAAGALLAVPVGATEQHGPHLPLSTDSDLAVALCDRLAGQRTDVLVAPPVAYGSSGEHAGFAGTLSIGQAATELLLVELGRSACETFAQVLFVSTHGGNAGPVSRAVATLRAEHRDVRAFAPSWNGDPHAGRTETALMLALRPLAVRQHRAVTGNTTPLRELLPELRSRGIRAVSESGILGDPSGATGAEGAALLSGLVAALEREITAWRAATAA